MDKLPTTRSKHLGLTYTPQASTFKLWSPTADKVVVNLYQTGSRKENTLLKSMPMTASKTLWTATIKEDLQGLFYTYAITRGEETVETVDLYAKAVGLNGDRGAIIDLATTDPSGWHLDCPPKELTGKLTDAFIWEVHVADFSSAKNAGIQASHQGKYLAFTEGASHLPDQPDIPTGLAHLKSLGVNYIHLLPAYDFANHELATAYNWGYDPKNYNVPEGRYATDPADPTSRIREFKELVQSLHQAGLGVILDVVYNHTFLTEESWFNLTEPNYFYRQDGAGGFADGSACGNEVASERTMVRKYLVESVLYWAQEYHLDGFRFDLMGLIDVATMNLIRKTLNEHGLQHVLMYGEPWDAGTNEIKAPNLPANKTNLEQLAPGIAVFNDDFRDSMKGFVFEEKDGGFIQGANGRKQKKRQYHDADVEAAILANTDTRRSKKSPLVPIAWAQRPDQTISYVAAHDNLTLWDKLVSSTTKKGQKLKYKRKEKLVLMNKIAAAIQFTSLGGIFIQAGEEFARTKFGDENSFVSPIEVNQLDWSQLVDFSDLTNFYRGMWQIRQAFPALRRSDAQAASAYRFAKDQTENLIAYTISDTTSLGKWSQLAVIVNSGKVEQTVKLRSTTDLPTKWSVIADNQQAGTTELRVLKTKNGKVTISRRSLLILAKEK